MAPAAESAATCAGCLEAISHPIGLQPAAVGHLHDVLVADQYVGMFGDRPQGGVGRPGPTFGAGHAARSHTRVHPEGQERPCLGDGPGERIGITAGEITGVRAGRQCGHRYVDLVLAFPLIDTRDGRLAGAVRVKSEHDPRAKFLSRVKCSSASAVPHVATARGTPAWKKPITSV